MIAVGAIDAGAVLPGAYLDDDSTRTPGQVRNEEQIVDHARRLSHKIASVVRAGRAPLVIGGDCSLLLAAGVALAPANRFGLVHVDGHTDFRHPGNSDDCASVAGEDLAAAVGLHWPAIADIDGLGPYFDRHHTVHVGCRNNDEHLAEARATLGLAIPAEDAITLGADAVTQDAKRVAGPHGYWLQLDVDVLDPTFMPAVDSPDAGGLNPTQLIALLRGLVPGAVGASVSVFDPELDPTGEYAALLTDIMVDGFAELGADHRPPWLER
jgi:arginase